MIALFAALSLATALRAEPLSPELQELLPAPAGTLLALRSFGLQEARPYPWMQGHPPIREGFLLALQADPELCRPRQTAEPVLYAGAVPAERLNACFPSGRMLLLVPGRHESLVLFFGEPDLPERIDAEDGARALADARAAGIAAFGPDEIDAASARGGAGLVLRDGPALDRAVADWIDAWAPDEAERAENLRAPAP